MAFAPPVFVEAPTRTPTPFGLFSVLSFRTATEGHELGAGIEFLTDECSGLPPVLTDGCDEEDRAGFPKVLDHFDSVTGGADPFTVYAPFECAMVGSTDADAFEAAERRLLLGEETAVATHLLTQAQATPATALPAAADVLGAVAALEQQMGESYDAQGIIWTSRTDALVGIDAGGFEIRNNRLQTPLGTPAVIVNGYDGDLTLTPSLVGYRSEVFSGGGPDGGNVNDFRTNTRYAVAERTYVIGFDTCPVYTVAVTAP